MHQDVQDKLRLELREARAEHGDAAYDELVALPYLDAICRETLRVYVLRYWSRFDAHLTAGTRLYLW